MYGGQNVFLNAFKKYIYNFKICFQNAQEKTNKKKVENIFTYHLVFMLL